MKNKLWIYGCSYSDKWDDSIPDEETWWGIIAHKCDLEVERLLRKEKISIDDATNCAVGGEGWLHTQQMILRTAKNWNKNDLVIIEEPPRNRTRIFNLDSKYSQPHGDSDNKILSTIIPVHYNNLKSQDDYKHMYISEVERLDEIEFNKKEKNWVTIQELLNFLQYRDTLLSLSNLHPNIYTWSNDGEVFNFYWKDDGSKSEGKLNPFWNTYKESIGNRLLHFGDYDNWTEWMGNHPSYWIDVETGDNHQNSAGHLAQGWLFLEQLENYQYISR